MGGPGSGRRAGNSNQMSKAKYHLATAKKFKGMPKQLKKASGNVKYLKKTGQ